MQRYFVDQIDNNAVTLTNDQEHHILKVMRMRTKDRITCVFNGEIYLCERCARDMNIDLKIEVIEKLEENNELDVNVTLLYCLPKGDKLELVLQKATELGVKEIILVQSERCVAKIKNEDRERKLKRFNSIVKEASEQSKRSFVPIINKIISFRDISKYPKYFNATNPLIKTAINM